MVKNKEQFNFSAYLKKKGIKDINLIDILQMHRTTFIKRKEHVEDFTLKEISLIAEHLNLTTQELIDKFLDQMSSKPN